MVKISQKLENACRVMVLLAREDQNNASHRVTRVEDLATAENLSANFLLQILNDLRRAGLVASKRGKHGGYVLAKPAAEITLRDIVEAVDGPLAPTDQSAQLTEAARAVMLAWNHAAEAFGVALAATTLESLAGGRDSGMFYI